MFLSSVIRYIWLPCVLGLVPQLPFDIPPHHPRDNSTAPFVFNSLSALLLQWSNTYHPNGHSMVSGVLEPYTLLYHARKDTSVPPPSPEWFAFDPEMSFAIMAGRGGHTYLHTYRTVRPARIVYFDGMSAALSETGWLDSQEVVIAKKGRGDDPTADYPSRAEYPRAQNLCKWGAPHSVEGFVRMNTGFEVMWCDFNSPSIQLVSHLNITPPGTPHVDPNIHQPFPPGAPKEPGGSGPRGPGHGGSGPSGPGRRQSDASPLARPARTEWLRAAAHRSLTPQAHVKLDYSSFVSFYHPRLRSLVRAREGQAMRHHRVWPSISDADAQSVVTELEGTLHRHRTGSGMDWVALARGIVEEWGDRVIQLREYLWNATTALSDGHSVNMTETLTTVQRLSYSPLNPYMDTSSPNASAWDMSVDLTPSSMLGDVYAPHFMNSSALHRCMFSATGVLLHNPHIRTTPQEWLLQGSVETVLARLCTDFGVIFSESMDLTEAPGDGLQIFLQEWETRMTSLMEWLDWTEWLRCDEVCPWDSVCIMSMWPGYIPRRGTNSTTDDDPAVFKPQCVKLNSNESMFPGRPRRGVL